MSDMAVPTSQPTLLTTLQLVAPYLTVWELISIRQVSR